MREHARARGWESAPPEGAVGPYAQSIEAASIVSALLASSAAYLRTTVALRRATLPPEQELGPYHSGKIARDIFAKLDAVGKGYLAALVAWLEPLGVLADAEKRDAEKRDEPMAAPRKEGRRSKRRA
jgi:hypothetical protein